MLANKLIIYVANPQYAPARHFFTLLASSQSFHVRGLKTFNAVVLPLTSDIEWSSADLISGQVVADNFEECEAAFMFIQPSDLSQVSQLTRSFVEIASKTGVRRLAWVAPACFNDEGAHLAEAESLVRSSDLETLVLRHAPLFSELLQKKELKFRRTLSLPLGRSALPWLAPEVIAQALHKWVLGEVNNQPPDVLTGPSQLSGEEIAQRLSEVLRQNANSLKFARARFESIDLDRSGQVEREELFSYLLELGYSNDEAHTILEEADTDKSGAINFHEFVQGLRDHLDKILAEVHTEVQYVNVPKSTALYDLTSGGMDENTAKSWLKLLEVLNKYGLPEKEQELAQWLGQTSICFTDWVSQYALDLINVHILPGRGILTSNEGYFEGRPALTTRLLQANDRLLIGQRTLDGKALELQWANEDLSQAEVVSYQPQEGGERTIKLKNGQIVSLSVRGSWIGRRLATQLFFQDKPIPRWQVSLFRELGELQIEEVSNLRAADDIVCNCTQTSCGKLQELIAGGINTLEQISDLTQVTMICGGCQPLVEEMLGSASLCVTELLAQENLGQGIVRFQFRPVHQAVVASKPGQHILIQGRMDNRWVTRAYTLSSAADQTQMYEITVKREEMGLFSRWLCDRAGSESLLRISEPRGEFVLEEENSAVFFAGGIGVTPAIAMMRTLANRGDHRKFHLDWCAPDSAAFVFQKELEQLTAEHPHLTFTLRATRTDGRLSAEAVQRLYPYTEGSVAFMCGPETFMKSVRGYLQEAGWSNSFIREELFSSKLNEEGKARAPIPQRPAVQLAGGICPVEHDSFDVAPVGSVMVEAEAFLKQCYVEQGLPQVFLPRWQEVKESIERTGTYEQTSDELAYGAKLAWRNSNRCVGRFFWQNLHVRDMRHLETEEEMFHALVEHIKFATNNGDVRIVSTIFRPDGRYIWNSQLLRYAGYRQPDGTILGDPANAELTEQVLKLGWPGGQRTRFDILPLIIQLPGKEPRWFEIPPEIVLEVPISHPRYKWFEELGLKWYALPAVSNMVFDVGGIQYTVAPYNAFYTGAEIGARNLSDTYRYNMLPTIAKRMELDCSHNMTLWKDAALVELNMAVLHSYKKHGVRIVDHHTMTDYFMRFAENELLCGRPVQADRDFIIPPMSPSTTSVFLEYPENRKLKPNYFYQPDPWKTTI